MSNRTAELINSEAARLGDELDTRTPGVLRGTAMYVMLKAGFMEQVKISLERVAHRASADAAAAGVTRRDG